MELEQKKRLRDGAELYFGEYCVSKHIDFVTFDDSSIKIGVSDNLTNLKKQATAFIDRISDDIALIETQEHKEEILFEYKRSLNCSQAITAVSARHRAIEEQRTQQAELEAHKLSEQETVKKVNAAIPAPISPPIVERSNKPDPTKTLVFKVTAPVSMLRELKRFLDDGGYHYK